VANAFDQFDSAAPAIGGSPSTATAVPPTAGANPFDQFDDAPTAFGGKGASAGPDQSSAPSSPTVGDVAKSAGWGLVTGIPHAIASTADLMEQGTANALTFSDPNTGENQFHQLARNLGIISGGEPATSNAYEPTTGNDLRNIGSAILDKTGITIPEPKNAPERIARTAGEFGSMMVAPELMGGKIGSAAKALGVGTVSGAASQTAAEAVPEKYKPLASLLGGVGGGMAGEAVASIPKVVGAGARAAVDYASPLTEGGQQRMAGTALREAASNPDEAINAIDSAQKNIVPGSNPTTYQLTGDTGLGQLERSVATQAPEPFLARRAEQNSARLDALNDIQAEGHPEAVSSFFKNQLDDLDNATQALHDTAQQEAQSAASGLGGGDAAVLGEQARTALQSRLDDVRERERGLWNAVDPEKNLQTVSSPIKQAVSQIYGNMGPESKLGMAPIEGQIANVVSEYGQTLPFQRLIDLRSAVSQAMRDARSPLSPNQPAYARLTQLRGAIESSISDSIAQKAAQEQQAVATGAMQPQETLSNRLQRESQEFMRAKRAGTGSLGTDNQELGGTFPGRPDVSSSQVREGSGEGSQTSGASQNPTTKGPFLDEEAAGRLKAATKATAERKQVFGAKPISQILQRPGTSQPFTMPSAGVTSSIWKAGNAGGDTVRSTLKAANNSADAVSAVHNMAAQSLRDRATDGVITPKALDAWKKQHSSALAALEEAVPGTMAKFENAASAGDHLAQVAADRKAALDSYQKSAAGRVLKVDDPADVVKTVGSIFDRKDSVAQMKSLVKEATKDPDAMAGLRKSIVEYMQNKLVSNTEAGTSGRNLIKSDAFQTFLGKNYTALRQVFSDEELGTMRAIAQDLKRANRSIASSKLPGQSNTAQDQAASATHNLKESVLTKILTHAVGGGAGFLGGGLWGSAAGVVGSHILGGMREAGIRNIQDLVRNAMLDPELAKSLMMKAPKKIDTGSELTVARRLGQIGGLSGIMSEDRERQH